MANPDSARINDPSGSKKSRSLVDPTQGVRFECQGSGRCCVSRGEYGFVYLTDPDRKAMAAHLGLSLREFTRDYCGKTDGYYHLSETKSECRFLKNHRCEVYEARPTQCRTWPFWPQNMDAKVWTEEVQSYCPGVGKGKWYSPEEIQKIVEENEDDCE